MTKQGINIKCKRCSKPFYAFPYEMQSRKFCSFICSNKATAKQQSYTKLIKSRKSVADNEKKWRYTIAYIEWHDKVFKRDDNTCQHCGSIKSLIAHHIKSYTEFPDLRIDINNGITLCRSCHNKHDKGIKSSQF